MIGCFSQSFDFSLMSHFISSAGSRVVLCEMLKTTLFYPVLDAQQRAISKSQLLAFTPASKAGQITLQNNLAASKNPAKQIETFIIW